MLQIGDELAGLIDQGAQTIQEPFRGLLAPEITRISTKRWRVAVRKQGNAPNTGPGSGRSEFIEYA